MFLRSSIPCIRTNQYGNRVFTDSNFILKDEKIIGKQVDDKIVELTNEDKESIFSFYYTPYYKNERELSVTGKR